MGKKGYILSGAALLAALTLLAGCGKNNDTEDKNKPDTDPAQEIVLVQPEAADVPVDFETAQKAWPDAYAYMKIPNATGCAIREGGFIAQHPVDDGWYLYRDLDGNDNKAGTLYTEATYNDTKLDDPVTVVYGHNMANRTMFGGLQSMLKNLDFRIQIIGCLFALWDDQISGILMDVQKFVTVIIIIHIKAFCKRQIHGGFIGQTCNFRCSIFF